MRARTRVADLSDAANVQVRQRITVKTGDGDWKPSTLSNGNFMSQLQMHIRDRRDDVQEVFSGDTDTDE
jgi:hypothetical protein